VLLNAAMTLDGKIATSSGDSRMSSDADMRRVHRLRASVDAIMIGLKTLLVDDPKLTVKYAPGRKPYRIIVDSKARTSLSSFVVRTARDIPTIIAVTSLAAKEKVDMLGRHGVTVMVCGRGPKVSLPILLRRLSKIGIQKVMLEGGGTLNWSMLSNHLVDEISVAITPRIIGGIHATSLVQGKGVALVKNGVKLKLFRIAKYGPDLVLHYKVIG
jgi:2,5-diamino-6-(ribosylamino)-4(3H)-pyrimidinone 5'-phosphate reductase